MNPSNLSCCLNKYLIYMAPICGCCKSINLIPTERVFFNINGTFALYTVHRLVLGGKWGHFTFPKNTLCWTITEVTIKCWQWEIYFHHRMAQPPSTGNSSRELSQSINSGKVPVQQHSSSLPNIMTLWWLCKLHWGQQRRTRDWGK